MCCALLRRLHRGLDECMCGKHKCGSVDSSAQWLTGQSIANALAVDRYTDTDQGNEDLTNREGWRLRRLHVMQNSPSSEFTEFHTNTSDL